MADLHKLTVQEAMNAGGSGGVWTVNTVATHDGVAATDTIHVDVSGAGQLGIFPAGQLYFNFSASETDVTIANDLKLPANVLTFITVPRGLGSTIYFNHLGVSACAVKIVEV